MPDTPIAEASTVPPAPPVLRQAPRWAAPIFCGLALALVPWTLWLAISLPTRHLTNHYDAAWSGFDVALAASLLATGLGIFRQATWTQGVASSAAALLVCDAWFDVTMSASGREQLIAIATAALVELPLAIACVFVARESEQMARRARGYVTRLRSLHLRRRKTASGGTSAKDDGAAQVQGNSEEQSDGLTEARQRQPDNS
ncbi:MAG TPA: hypothetical protein VHZ31_09645 [Solirubrobacteraceae bacterium]|jgi:hypothetical protein|nr:hypothetical protein [Solirubrobacteraceae bacterium]